MKSLRTVIFWTHLAVGAAAGLVIFIMSVTGVALTYEKQMIEWADRNAWTAPASNARHLPPESLLAAAAATGATPIGITLRADAAAPATVILEGNKALLIDPYSGAIIGEPPAAMRSFFRTMTMWHRYLALEGASRATGKLITGAANLGFLFIVVSGLYLWFPRAWTWLQFKNVLWFRTNLAPKARDFNWHNVIGFWCAPVLICLTATGLVISYPWASNLIYTLTGSEPPAPQSRPAERPQSQPAEPAQPRSQPAEPAQSRSQAGERTAERPSSPSQASERRVEPPFEIPANLDTLWANAEKQASSRARVSVASSRGRTCATSSACCPPGPRIDCSSSLPSLGRPRATVTKSVVCSSNIGSDP